MLAEFNPAMPIFQDLFILGRCSLGKLCQFSKKGHMASQSYLLNGVQFPVMINWPEHVASFAATILRYALLTLVVCYFKRNRLIPP